MITSTTTHKEAIQAIRDQLDEHEFLIDPDDIRSILKRFEVLIVQESLRDIRTQEPIKSIPEQEERLYSESEQL